MHPRRGWRAVAGGLVLVPAALAAAIAPRAAAAAASAPPSSIGNEAVLSLQVSPGYSRTGLAVAVSAALGGCSRDCVHVWVTRDGGSAWQRAAARGFEGGHPLVIALDAAGAEHLYAGTSSDVQRSDDLGESWTTAGGGGIAAVAPAASGETAVTVAGGGAPDYLLAGGGSHPVGGSGGRLQDTDLMLAPGFPAAGSRPPALLTGIDPGTGLPVLQRCSAALSCSGAIALAGATRFSSPVSLTASSAYADDGAVFAQSGTGIYKSIDGGATYTPLSPAPGGGDVTTATPMLSLAAGYREAGPVRTLYVAVLQVHTRTRPQPGQGATFGGIYRSDDGGTTWRQFGARSPFDAGAMAVAVAPTGRVFGAYIDQGFGGLLCNDGAGWHASCAAQGAAPAAAGPAAAGPSRPAPAGGPGGCTGCAPTGGGPPAGPPPGGGPAPGVAGSPATGPAGSGASAPGGGAAAPAASMAAGDGRGPGPLLAAIAGGALLLLAGARLAGRFARRPRG